MTVRVAVAALAAACLVARADTIVLWDFDHPRSRRCESTDGHMGALHRLGQPDEHRRHDQLL